MVPSWRAQACRAIASSWPKDRPPEVQALHGTAGGGDELGRGPVAQEIGPDTVVDRVEPPAAAGTGQTPAAAAGLHWARLCPPERAVQVEKSKEWSLFQKSTWWRC
jgi:hypothetical protein